MNTDNLTGIPVKRPEWVQPAVRSAMRGLRLIEDGVLPASLTGFFLRTTALRLLRCVSGSDAETARILGGLKQ